MQDALVNLIFASDAGKSHLSLKAFYIQIIFTFFQGEVLFYGRFSLEN